jgi:DNA-binding transcriptional LysR family regulator
MKKNILKTNTSSEQARLDWSLIPSFLSVLDTGSLLAAAKYLKMAQPTLGRHIDELEKQLGVALFERTVRGLVPTEIAGKLASSARAMENASHSLHQIASGQCSDLTGSVRITCSQSVAVSLMPPLISKLRLTVPHIQIELVSSNQIKNLLRREADIALRMVRPVQVNLIAKKLCEMPIAPYASLAYLRRRGQPEANSDLFDHELIGYDQDQSIIQGFKSFHGADIKAENFAFRTDDHIAYFEAVKAGLGIGFVAVHQAQKCSQLKRVLPKMKLPSLPVWLTTHKEIHGNARIRFVFDFLASEFALACRV